MNILVLGSGGREHALATALAKSPNCDKVYVAPGNAGTARAFTNIELELNDFEAIAKFCSEFSILMVIVGPEGPLAAGIADYFAEHEYLSNIFIVGPDRNAAQLESSKQFAKAFLQRHGIPTARSGSFTAETLEKGLAFLNEQSLPIVLKADGLASGKGVIIAESLDEAERDLRQMLSGQLFGEAGHRVVIEEFLKGIELSVIILTDGREYVQLPEAKDYKRVGAGDTGPNTGGMGAVSPVPFADAAFMQKVRERIIEPTLKGLQQDQLNYCGFLFIGLMNVGGDPFVIEYNVRLGDPETEAILPRIESDFFDLLRALHDKQLDNYQLQISTQAAATVVLTAAGYPGEYKKGTVVSAYSSVTEQARVFYFHAGTKLSDTGEVLTNGGRVMAITALAETPQKALACANETASQVQFEGKTYRTDIGMDLFG